MSATNETGSVVNRLYGMTSTLGAMEYIWVPSESLECSSFDVLDLSLLLSLVVESSSELLDDSESLLLATASEALTSPLAMLGAWVKYAGATT